MPGWTLFMRILSFCRKYLIASMDDSKVMSISNKIYYWTSEIQQNTFYISTIHIFLISVWRTITVLDWTSDQDYNNFTPIMFFPLTFPPSNYPYNPLPILSIIQLFQHLQCPTTPPPPKTTPTPQNPLSSPSTNSPPAISISRWSSSPSHSLPHHQTHFPFSDES